MDSAAIEEPWSINPKMYSILVSDSSEYEKAKGVTNNIVAKIGHSDYKNVCLNKRVFA